MWPFKTRKDVNTYRQKSLTGFTDWHSHILPGVDDGIKTLEDSLEVLRKYDEAGIKKIWLTPHIMEDFPNTTSELRKRFEELCDAWTGNVELGLASENMLDALFDERLKSDDLLPIGDGGDNLLVETSYFSAPMGFDHMLEEIMHHGYRPVIAHPERYMYMDHDSYRRLHDKGVIFQLNLLSLTGAYGEKVRKKAVWLMKEGLVDIIGCDLHRTEQFSRIFGDVKHANKWFDKALSLGTEFE